MIAHAQPELTKNQALVFGSLSDAGGPLTAYAILDLLRENGFRAPLQVYRALDKLVEYGMVHRLESLNAFVACSHKGCAEHGTAAFAICENCGDVSEFTPDEVIKLLKEWTQAEGFTLARTTIELRGTCRDCISQPN
ncbi:Zinc uptake regulation protein [Roseibium album]|uniref:Zinc uptake regulation protein n=1 Tax=Roseibium album TaxID=311410 RepID=A0A0M6ZHV8_9HYPH|nr:Fur family zinc uptake transcriptional regulator [Labrenzia sp. EL_142]MBG6155610.1 Fur family zinc uptake transcriptional regulator [Labrenzia sp. EL_162]MBG6161065.1 Fur family zinc uptake transcriptional regulator [Labrenzia sp. EL_195]MBG6194144.1 Fur family zinc uptake transcriptional regulator [Labrenzia sp. EL_159]MBG6200881.1 Fur family zinc uptake transcriptional regulator [Labrenzia sp. EL_13]MBG6205766.1 Fur family zinc uptake transcriptional regulator [Labrenzia sp. EL_126]MCR9